MHPLLRDINFATRDYRLSGRLVAGLIAAGAALAVLTALMIWTSSSYRSQRNIIDRQAAELAGRADKLGSVLEERDRLLRELNAMSGLLETKRFSWTALLTGIEQVFPAGAALDRLQYNPKDKSLVLDGKAQSPEALRNLMVQMEKSPVFQGALLKHQSVEKGTISFTVGAQYREQVSTGSAR